MKHLTVQSFGPICEADVQFGDLTVRVGPQASGKSHADAKFVMDLDDGVMVNSATRWPLLEPQWKDVAHKCFWDLQPAKAYAWEFRLHDEIQPDFTIDEPQSNEARATFLNNHEREAREILAKELKRRERRSLKADAEGESQPLFEPSDDDGAENANA